VGASLAAGMYVRVGIDAEHDSGEFRDYRIGRIVSIDPIARMATLSLHVVTPGEASRIEHTDYPLDQVERCRILPDSDATYVPTGQPVRVLMPREGECADDHLRMYYALANDQVVVLATSRIRATTYFYLCTDARSSQHSVKKARMATGATTDHGLITHNLNTVRVHGRLLYYYEPCHTSRRECAGGARLRWSAPRRSFALSRLCLLSEKG